MLTQLLITLENFGLLNIMAIATIFPIIISHFSSKETFLLHGVMIDLHNCYNKMVLLEPTVFSLARRNVPAFKATPSANLLATF